MGIGLSTYDTWRNKDRVPEKKLRQIAEDREVRYEWLSKGEGPKFEVSEPMFLTPELKKAIEQNIKKGSPCEENEKLHDICRAFLRITEEKQEDALKAVIATIAKFY
jgi:hypothetical protein